MDPALHQKILSLLDDHRIMSLATLRPDGWPQATTVGYVSDGLTLYFMCGQASQKARNLAADSRVSLTVDRDVPDPLAIEGLSMAGHARRVLDEEVIRRLLLGGMLKKYPEYAAMSGSLDFSQIAVFKVEPHVISVLDYSKGFGHCDLVEVDVGDRQAA